MSKKLPIISLKIEERYQKKLSDSKNARIVNRRNVKRIADRYPEILTDLEGRASSMDAWEINLRNPEFIYEFCRAVSNHDEEGEVIKVAEQINSIDFSEFINSVNKPQDVGLRIVFVSCVPYFTILREAKALTNLGHHVSLISLNPMQEELKETFDDVFQSRIDCMNSWQHMASLVSKLDADVFHVQCRQSDYGIARLVHEAKRSGICVAELYDVASTQGDRETIQDAFALQDVDYDLAMEEYILRNVDAVVHRISEKIFDKVLKKYNVENDHLTFYPYPTEPVENKTKECALNMDGPIKLVYTGSVHPIDEGHKGSPIRLMIDTFESLAEQGFEIDLLCDPNLPIKRSMAGYEPYFTLMDKYPNFRIYPGVPPLELPQFISAYDFGIALTDISPEQVAKMQDLLIGSVGTKLFGYLEAGLPVLWTAEWQFSSSYLEKHDVGYGLSYDQRRNLKSFLNSIDYKKLRLNVKKYNTIYNINEQIPKLVDLYLRAIEKK